MWGSDFCQTQDRPYAALVDLAQSAFAGFSEDERRAVFVETPRRLWPGLVARSARAPSPERNRERRAARARPDRSTTRLNAIPRRQTAAAVGAPSFEGAEPCPLKSRPRNTNSR